MNYLRCVGGSPRYTVAAMRGEPPTQRVFSFAEISLDWQIMNALTTCWREVGVS